MTHRWRFAWSWTVAVCLLLPGCRPPGQPPGPPQPPPQTCPDLGVPWCHEAGMSCGECQHQPPGEACPIKAPPCDMPPEPPDPPVLGCVLSGDPGAELPGYVSPPYGPDNVLLGERVNQAITSLTNCRAPERCVIVVPPQEFQAAVAQRLREWGLCAGQDDPGADEIRVQHPATLAGEGFHIYAGGGWSDPTATGTVVWYVKLAGPVTGPPYAGSARPVFALSGGAQPPEQPPPVGDVCPFEPCPLREWTRETLPDGWGDNEIGRPAFEVKAQKHTMGNGDATVVVIRQEPYCAAIGMSPYADGQPRQSCPMRNEYPEGHPDRDRMLREREAIERWILRGGFVRDGRNDQDCTPNHSDNPAAVLWGTGNCRVCSADVSRRDDPRSCSEWN